MPLAEPLMVSPEICTLLPVPTVAELNRPVADPALSTTLPPSKLPTRAALAALMVAVVVPSYSLLLAVMPLTVRVLPVIEAVVVGCEML